MQNISADPQNYLAISSADFKFESLKFSTEEDGLDWPKAARKIGIQRHHNLDLGGKHIREYSKEREREPERGGQSGKINVTYIVELIIIFSTVQAWAAQPLANIKPKIGLRLLIITSEVSCIARMVKGCVLSLRVIISFKIGIIS